VRQDLPQEILIEPTSCIPESSLVEEIPKYNKGYHFGNISPVLGETSTKTDWCYIRSIVVISSTRLPEFAIPVALADIHLKPEMGQAISNRLNTVYRDNDVVPIDTHFTRERFHNPSRQSCAQLLFDAEKYGREKDHRLDRDAQRGAQRRELAKGVKINPDCRYSCPSGPCCEESLPHGRKTSQHGLYMQDVHAIRSFAQIERRQILLTTALAGQNPIWVLVCKTKEVKSKIVSGVTRNTLTFEKLDYWTEQGLLHILHTGWLDSNDSRGLERFRDGNDPYGSFRLRFKELYTVQLVIIPPAIVRD
jgi:hypothetical protein